MTGLLRRLAPAAAAATLLLLSGCAAQVTTTFRVTSASTAQVSTGVTFTGDAAAVLHAEAGTRDELVAVFRSRLGRDPQVKSSPDEVTVSVQVPYTDLAKVADITGVTAATLSGTDDAPQLQVDLGAATKVTDAVRQASTNQPEPDAVTATMLDSAHLVTRVVFAGGVETATAKVTDPGDDGALTDVPVTVAGDTATLTRPVGSAAAGTLLVSGDPTSSTWLWWAGGGLVGCAVLVLLVRRGR